MTSGLSKLIDPSRPIVLDANVAINLAATDIAERIVGAIPNAVIVTDAVLDDLARNARHERKAHHVISELTRGGAIKKVSVADFTQGYFEELIVGNGPDTLDDGEASTVAYALEWNATPVIDERKAHRICATRYKALDVATTTDLLCHSAVERALGRADLAEAALKALGVHMRVLPDHIDWIVGLIGRENAAKSLSLPASVRAKILKAGPG